jgi:hypothetical protein
MARKKKLCKASNGLFMRNIGWKRTPSGYAQHKFYLGRDEAQAELASRRLELLWDQVCKRWEREAQGRVDGSIEVHCAVELPSIPETREGKFTAVHCRPAPVPLSLGDAWEAGDRPVWNEVTLAIADAVRNGEAVAGVPLPLPMSAMVPDSPHITAWLADLGRDFTGIKIELRDEERQARSQEQLQQHGQRLVEEGRRIIQKVAGGGTLHAAFDAYSTWINSKYVGIDNKVTQWGATQTRQVAFIKRHLPNLSFDEMDAARIDDLIGVLQRRPAGEDGAPVSVSWTRNCIKQFRHFLRWLNKRPEFGWKRPADLELEVTRIPLTPGEKSAQARPTQVQTYTLAELKTLYEYATPFQRLLMLLALNCGFGRAEVASLEMDDLFLRKKHPHEREVGCATASSDSWVCRVRHKSAVYGEWKLWPATVAAIDWWLRQRAKIFVEAGVTTVLVTSKGQRYDAPTRGNHPNFQIPNSWIKLTDRVRKDHTDFRALSYNKLRKTVSNLVREAESGEIAAVFLCHGKPVQTDSLLDLYTNRPFAKVFEVLDRVGDTLAPLWAAVTDPFPEEPVKGGPNISPGKIRRIQRMKQQGFRIGAIAKELNLSSETVRRWVKRAKPGGSTSQESR